MSFKHATSPAFFFKLSIVLTVVTLLFNRQFIRQNIAYYTSTSLNSVASPSECQSVTPPDLAPTIKQRAAGLVLPPVLQAYVERHASIRACYTAAPCSDTPRALVWKCLTDSCGGLGDRIRGLRLIFLMAIALDRAFFIEWPVSPVGGVVFPLTTALIPNFVDWRIPEQLLRNATDHYRDIRNNFILFKQPAQNVLFNPFKPIPSKTKVRSGKARYQSFPLNSTDFNDLFDPYHVLYISNRIQRSALNALAANKHLPILVKLREELSELGKTDALHRLLTRMLFRPTEEVAAAAVARALEEDAVAFRGNATDYIAIHARTGFDLNETTSRRLREVQRYSASFTANKLLRCATKLAPDLKRLFVASDSQELKRVLTELGEGQGLAVHSHDAITFHIDKPDEKTKERRCAAYFDVFADLIALSNSRKLVHLHSGFASTAIDFGDVQQAVEIDVRQADSDIDRICEGSRQSEAETTSDSEDGDDVDDEGGRDA